MPPRFENAEDVPFEVPVNLPEYAPPTPLPRANGRREFVSASKENTVAETNSEGSLTLPFAPISEDLEGESDEPAWLWSGYVAPSAVTLWSGWPKVGKTTMLFALLGALEKGEPFLGLPTRAAGVLLLTEERKGTLASKVRRWSLPHVHRLRRHQARDVAWPDVVRQAVAYSREHASASSWSTPSPSGRGS